MHSTVRLAQMLAEFSPSELEQVLRERNARVDTPHLTDLALQLLTPESLTRALRGLTTAELHALRSHVALTETGNTGDTDLSGAADSDTARLRSLALIAPGGPLPEVRDALTALLDTHGPLPSESPKRTDETREPTPHWSQRAFLETQQAVLVWRFAKTSPLKLTRSGTLAKATEKLIADEIQARPEPLGVTVAALRAIGALVELGSHLHTTPDGESWSRLPHPARWLVLAAGHLVAMPHPLAHALSLTGTDLRAARDTVLPRLYPLLDDETLAVIREYVGTAEQLAVTAGGVLTPPAHTCVQGGSQPILDALSQATEAFPQVAPGVYLQPDLSVIAPGPIDPRIGLRLLEIADLTAPGLATSLVITDRTLSRALDHGWTTDEIREFLTQVSLTPIPQPLEYLLGDLAARHGAIVVAPLNTPDGATVVRVRDPRMTSELLADPRLSMLGLTVSSEAPNTLVTRLASDHVCSILSDARYPATRDSSAQRNETPITHEVAEPDSGWVVSFIERIITQSPADTNELAETVTRLTRPAPDGDRVDIVPVLELAARIGQHLMITVSDGKRDHHVELLPLSIAQGRLRALDPRAGLERTISIRAITAVEPVHNSDG